MKRWHEEASQTAREWKKYFLHQIWMNSLGSDRTGKDPDQLDDVRGMQKGRFRKRHAFDCGNTRCRICHSDKCPKREKTRQELFVDLRFREELEILRS